MFPKQAEYIEEKEPATRRVEQSAEPEDTQKSRAKLLGIPDFTPPTYEDLAPNISYSSDGRAYIGFDDYEEAESFRKSLDIPFLIPHFSL